MSTLEYRAVLGYLPDSEWGCHSISVHACLQVSAQPTHEVSRI